MSSTRPGAELARHARDIEGHLLIEGDHCEGRSTREVERPTLLGRWLRSKSHLAVALGVKAIKDGSALPTSCLMT